jgi:ribosomal protein L11 methyltransferase
MRSSRTKPLWRISVLTSLEAEDAVSELVAIATDHATAAYFNLETGVSTVSAFSKTSFNRGIRAEIMAGLARIKDCGLKIEPARIQIARVKREDWAESWKKHFKAMEIGRALLVKPSWIKRRPQPGQAVVILDPGLSFGTGQHPTTAFCLAQIVGQRKKRTPQSFLDIGTGSGILAIAAAKLEYHPVHAFDFDPACVQTAKANAQTNGVKIRVTRGDVIQLPLRPKRQFDLVGANLISNLLIAEREKIAARVKPDGTLVLAGILATEFPVVQDAFAACGLRLVASKTEKEWRSGAFRFVGNVD